MNRLKEESSLYLLQHADNPVHWYPYGQEALSWAKEENKPILISVGYSTCHWCHVMARESFSDPEIASFMNQHFINIKVDREERPDIDDMCMEVLLTVSGNGGWPCNVFLTSDGRPFFGGTYFPPDNRFGRHSWKQVLESIVYQYRSNYTTISKQADNILSFLRDREGKIIDQEDNLFFERSDGSVAETIVTNLREEFDSTFGGFGPGQKFPMFSALELLAVLAKSGSSKAMEMFEFTLEKILSGGIYDQICGGLFRYTVDRAWKIPHFEKMLYDNALFLKILAISVKMNPTKYKINKLRQTVDFVRREMRGDDGFFYAAINAESEGEEGKFYVWVWEELEQYLKNKPEYLVRYFDIDSQGNWEGKIILNERKEILDQYDIRWEDAESEIAGFTTELFKLRDKRVRPDTDKKNILSWNCWMIIGLLEAAEALQDKDLGREMKSCFDNLEKHFVEKNKILRIGVNSNKKIEAFAEDLSAWLQVAIKMFEYTGEDKYVRKSINLAGELEREFLDVNNGFLRNMRKSADGILVSKLNLFDYSTPSENAMFVESVRKLYALTGDQRYIDIFTGALEKTFHRATEIPASMSGLAMSGVLEKTGRKEVVIIGQKALIFKQIVSNKYLPEVVLAVSEDDNSELLVYQSRFKSGQTIAYICQNGVCGMPVKDVKEFVKMF